MNENALARWRGRHIGIVFQLVQALTALENVLLALKLGGGGSFKRREWRASVLWPVCRWPLCRIWHDVCPANSLVVSSSVWQWLGRSPMNLLAIWTRGRRTVSL